jgi:hypothetical protein
MVILAAIAGPRVPRGVVTRQRVVLTDFQSLVDCQQTLLFPPPPLCFVMLLRDVHPQALESTVHCVPA